MLTDFCRALSVRACFILAFSIGLSAQGAFANGLTLEVGNPEVAHVALGFSADKTSDAALVIGTRKADVAGSRLSLSVDGAKTNLFDHILTDTECRFVNDASACQVTIPASDPAYEAIVEAFKRGLKAHVEVENAGSMEMSDDLSLKGFTRAYNGL